MTIKKLRNKILDLAIHGRLVKQDANDEPASTLLARIRQEKEQLVKDGKLKKKDLVTTPVSDEDKPFEVPEGWEWVTVKDVCQSCLGKMLDKSKNQGTPQPYLRNVNVRWGAFDLSDLLEMPFTKDEDERYSITIGDIIVCEGGEPGRCAIWNEEYSIKFQKALHRVRCHKGIINYYITSVLEWYANSQNIEQYFTGSTIKHLTGESLNSILIPLPPLAEQQRIVAAVEQWMSLVDIIESGKEKLQQSIALAKNKILDLAIKGKLVEKEGEWEEKTLASISTDSADGPFGSNLKREHYTLNKEVRIIQLSNIGEEGWRDENTRYTTFEHLPNIARSEVHPGDIVIAKMMPAGRAILCPSDDKKYVLSSDAVKFVLKENVYDKYVLNAINSSYFREQVYDDVQGVTRVRTSLKKLREYTIPLPPLSEQQRIVAKIEELFAQLDIISNALK